MNNLKKNSKSVTKSWFIQSRLYLCMKPQFESGFDNISSNFVIIIMICNVREKTDVTLAALVFFRGSETDKSVFGHDCTWQWEEETKKDTQKTLFQSECGATLWVRGTGQHYERGVLHIGNSSCQLEEVDKKIAHVINCFCWLGWRTYTLHKT